MFCLRVLLLGVTLYLVVCGGCACFQRRLMYFPSVFTRKQAEEAAAFAGLERWASADGRPIGWKRPSSIRPVLGQVLIAHGNAGSACHRGHYADVLQKAAALDVFILEYPGYGDRPGVPSERSLGESSLEALQLLATNGPVYLVGESLGTGVAAYLAGRCPEKVSGLALLAPFSQLAEVAQAHLPLLPVRLLLRDRFPAAQHLRGYHGPVAVLLAGRDEVVPERFGRRLYDGYAGPKRLWEFAPLDHESLMFQPPEVWREIVAFWRLDRREPRP